MENKSAGMTPEKKAVTGVAWVRLLDVYRQSTYSMVMASMSSHAFFSRGLAAPGPPRVGVCARGVLLVPFG